MPVRLLLSIFIALFLTSCGDDQLTLDEAESHAHKLFAAEEYEQCINFVNTYEAESGIKSQSALLYLWALQALSYKNMGEYRSSIELLNRILKTDRIESLYVHRGDCFSNLNIKDSALMDYTEALKINDRNENAYNSRGLIYFNLEKYEAAIADFDAAIDISPDNALPYFYEGLALEKIGDKKAAIKCYTQSIWLNDSSNTAYRHRAALYADAKEYTLAIDDYKNAIGIDSLDATSYYNLGIMYAKIEKNDSCCICLKKAAQFGIIEAEELLNVVCDVGKNHL